MAAEQIPRLSGLSRQAFLDEYVRPARPVILTDAIADWPALRKWGFDSLAAEMGDEVVPIEHYEGGDRTRLGAVKMMPLREYLTQIRHSEKARRELYLAEREPAEVLAAALPDFRVPDLIDAKTICQTSLFMGVDTFSATHYHPNRLTLHSHQACLTQVFGRKTVIMYPPEDWTRLRVYPWYSVRSNFSTLRFDVSMNTAEKAERDLGLQGVTAHECTIDAGEMLLIPAHWHHVVFGHGENASVTFFWDGPLAGANRTLLVRDLVGAGIDKFMTRPLTKLAFKLGVGDALVRLGVSLGMVPEEDAVAANSTAAHNVAKPGR